MVPVGWVGGVPRGARLRFFPPAQTPPTSSGTSGFALGTYRDLWAGPITELNPPLQFLKPEARVEIAPGDAQRLGVDSGDLLKVAQNGSQVTAPAIIKERVPEGTVFIAEGVAGGNANSLLNGGPVRVEISKVEA